MALHRVLKEGGPRPRPRKIPNGADANHQQEDGDVQDEKACCECVQYGLMLSREWKCVE